MTGRAELSVSRITLGTMRLAGTGGAGETAQLLAQACDIGVRSFHCSAEYESYPLFVAAWARSGAGARAATLVAKLASPHFGEDRFSAAQVRDKIERYLRDLRVERIDTVQWLLRHDLANESVRLRILHEAADELADLTAALKREGKIGAFVGFPYTRPIADALVTAEWCDGLAVYVNPLEREMDSVVEACAVANDGAGKAVLAIRPFAAGRVFTETALDADAALMHAFGFPAVASVVVSVSGARHLAALRGWL